MTRDALLTELADAIAAIERPHPLRVAVDGPDAAGKTTLADELVRPLRDRGRSVIRASIDEFHRPPADRYRQGRDSPVGYYEDSFDYDALRRVVLEPLGQNAPRDAVLLLDGVFLLRPELVGAWDFRIFVSIPFGEVLRRGVDRDAGTGTATDELAQRYRTRYIPGQELYLARAEPIAAADVVVENSNPLEPELRWIRPAS